MQGILDFLKTPAGQGLLATGLGAAASAGRGRGLIGNLGAGGLMGLQAYSGADEAARQAAQDAKRNELYDMQVKAYKADVERKNAALDAEKRKREALPGLFRAPGMTGGEAVPQSMGGIPMFSQPMGVSPMRPTPGGFDVMGALSAGYTPEEIEKLANIKNVGRPKATRQMEVDDGKGGKRIALVDDFGNEVAGFSGYTAPVQVNRGDRVDFVRPAPGVSLSMNMSPEARASNALGWANNALTRRGQDLADARSRETLSFQREKDRLDRTSGGGNASEGERKAATLLQRLEGSQRQLQSALAKNPGAAKPELLASAIRGTTLPLVGQVPGAETLANTVTSEARQRIEAAQLDMLDAALTLGTGAAYTREQLEGYRKSYFPQLGDDPQTVKDKQDRLQNVINAARLAAGRAAPRDTVVTPEGDGSDPLGLRK
jgi:hypothetical protein